MELDLQKIIAGGLLVGLRVGTLMLFMPFFGDRAVPPRAKAGLTVALTVLLFPVFAPRSLPEDIGSWLAVAGHETIVGLMIGLIMHFVFEAVQLAGQILGFQLGFSLANVIDPQTQVDTPVLSVAHQMIALLIFLQLDVHHWILRGIGKSFEFFPLNSSITPATVSEFLRLAGGVWVIAAQIAAPALMATFVADMTLGFLAKASPQFHIMILALPAKNLLGYAILLGAAAFWPGVLQKHFLEAIQGMERLLGLAQ